MNKVKKDDRVYLRMSKKEKEAFQKFASANNMTLSEFILFSMYKCSNIKVN